MSGQTGNGATITFSPSGFTARYRQIGGLREFHNAIDETALSDTYENVCAAKLRRNDPIDVELYWDTDWRTPTGAEYGSQYGPPLGNNEQTVVITYPPKPGQTNGAKRTAKAVVLEVTSPVLANETELVGSYQLKFREKPAITPGS